MAGTGRPSKPYRTSWDENIDGLRPKGNGRWEIRSKGIRFTEHDEEKAVERAKAILGIATKAILRVSTATTEIPQTTIVNTIVATIDILISFRKFFINLR